MAGTSEARRLLAGCDAVQQEAITTEDSPLLVVAGAGSGKTRVLTRRVAWRISSGSALPEHVLALTFTRKAAAELRTRLAGLGVGGDVTAGTFHAVALRELRRRAVDAGRRPPVLLDSKVRLLAELLPAGGRDLAGTGRARPVRATREARPGHEGGGAAHDDRSVPLRGTGPGSRELLTQLASELDWAAARRIGPEAYPAAALSAGRQPPVPTTQVAELFARFEEAKRRRGVLDFDDLLSSLAGAIVEDPEFAAVQRWRWRHLFVDELQDVNAAQLALLDAWLGPSEDLCAVGDGRQAIYGWNGAETDALGLFRRRFPVARVIELATNYRSTPQVVAFASAALPRRRSAGPDAAGAAPAAVSGPAAEAARPDGSAVSGPAAEAARPDGSVPTLRSFDDEELEAAAVARALRLAHRPGRRWGDCAVLARTNAQLVVLEQAIRRAGIPLRVGSGEAFVRGAAVRRALGALRRETGTGGFSRWLADLELADSSAPGGGAGSPGDDEDDELAPAGSGAGGNGAAGSAAAGSENEELAALARLAAEYAVFDSWPTTDGFIAWLGSALGTDPAPVSSDSVELLTFHRAKGLEWSVVFVTGLEDGFVPIAHARSSAALEEERRLLYVALTRAVDELHCSWCANRTFGRRRTRREPSPFLAAVDAVRRQLEREERPDPGRARAALAATRAQLQALPQPADPLRSRGDRAGRARSALRPAPPRLEGIPPER